MYGSITMFESSAICSVQRSTCRVPVQVLVYVSSTAIDDVYEYEYLCNGKHHHVLRTSAKCKYQYTSERRMREHKKTDGAKVCSMRDKKSIDVLVNQRLTVKDYLLSSLAWTMINLIVRWSKKCNDVRTYYEHTCYIMMLCRWCLRHLVDHPTSHPAIPLYKYLYWSTVLVVPVL